MLGEEKVFSETCIAPVNIAVIKYWGKRNEELILPTNDSLSLTLSTDQMHAKTTISVSSSFKENKMWLNGDEVLLEHNIRIKRCIEKLKGIAEKRTAKFPLDWKVHICSENNFPTAAGLASSAAGFACLVFTFASLFGIENEDLTPVARLGSGSASRSLHGGFVHWIKGEFDDGSDSIAVQVQPSTYWPEMRILILVVNDARKKVTSADGMLRSVKTSDLLKYRVESCVPQRIIAIKKAIDEKDFKCFADITMKDSNQFHAVCLDTYPPCIYMNDLSHLISEFVHKFNEISGETKLAYTFDAGPNACLYLLENDVPNVLAALNKAFPNDNCSNVEYIKGIPIDGLSPKNNIFDSKIKLMKKNALKYIIYTRVGEGPRKLKLTESLLNEIGLPK